MDYNGNITSIFTFDNILRTSNNDLFIAKYNNKYGLINHKNETKLQFQYDYIYIYGDYILTIKDNLLSIYNNKYKEIVKDIKVYIPDKDFYDYESETKFNVFLYADNLYIKLFSNKNDEEYTNYLVNKKGIQKSITGDATPIYKNGIIKFFYTEKLNDGKIELNIYDLDFIEYYNLNISCDYGDYTFDIDNIINTNNYMISINYHYKDKDDLKVYYIDLFNSREINEFDAIYNYLDNGYGFVLDTNNDLKVYKNEKILDTFNNIDGYLGDYYFYSNIYNKYAIYKLEFKKGSKYVK